MLTPCALPGGAPASPLCWTEKPRNWLAGTYSRALGCCWNWPGLAVACCRVTLDRADLDSDVNAKLPRSTPNVSLAAMEFKIALRIDDLGGI